MKSFSYPEAKGMLRNGTLSQPAFDSLLSRGMIEPPEMNASKLIVTDANGCELEFEYKLKRTDGTRKKIVHNEQTIALIDAVETMAARWNYAPTNEGDATQEESS